MKSRKTMKHQPLIQEAITQLSSRFNPKVSDVKKAIDQLLDKEYLERVEGQRDLFSCAFLPSLLPSWLVLTISLQTWHRALSLPRSRRRLPLPLHQLSSHPPPFRAPPQPGFSPPLWATGSD